MDFDVVFSQSFFTGRVGSFGIGSNGGPAPFASNSSSIGVMLLKWISKPCRQGELLERACVFMSCATLLVRLKGWKRDRFEKAKINDRESNGGERFHSEKLEELISLEKSVPLNSSVAFKFGNKIVHCKSASNRFQPMLCHEGIFGVHFYT